MPRVKDIEERHLLMSRRRTGAIALGVGAATAVILSLWKVNKEFVIGSTTTVTVAAAFVLYEKKTTQDENDQKNGSQLMRMKSGNNSNRNFIAYWDLNKFNQLLQKGIELGSKYFFLIKDVDVYLFVRESDFKGTRTIGREDTQLLIHAVGLNENQPSDLDSEEEKKELDHLRFESGQLYEGDLCEWFHISDELLMQVDTKIKEGYTRLKLIVKPLELDAIRYSKEEIRDLKDNVNVFVHKSRISSGAKCDISPFNANIKFQYTSNTASLNFDKAYSGNTLFIDNDLAEQIIREKARDDWDNHFEALRDGDTEEENENHEKAIEYYSKAIELIGTNPTGFHKRSISYYMLSEYDKALNDSNQSIRLNPKHDYYGTRGAIKSCLNDYEGAINDFKKSLEINSKNAIVYYFLGEANEEVNDFKSALENYSEAIKNDPKSESYYRSRANIKIELEDLDGAIEDYSKAIELDANSLESFFNRGNARADSDDHEGAILDYSEVIELDPTHEFAFYYRALSKDHTSDYEGSIDDLNKTIELNPENAQAFNTRGLIKKSRSTNDWDSAVKDFKKAIEVDPTYAMAFYNLGDIIYDIEGEIDCNEKEKLEESIKYLTIALDLDPTIEEAYRFREWSLRRIGRHHEAINDCDKLIEINSKNGEAYQELGLNQKELKKFDSAISNLSKSIELLENDEYSEIAYSYLLRGEAKKGLGDLTGACEDWKKAAQLGDEDAVRLLEDNSQ